MVKKSNLRFGRKNRVDIRDGNKNERTAEPTPNVDGNGDTVEQFAGATPGNTDSSGEPDSFGGIPTFDPGSLGGGSASGEPARKRGRPVGTTSKASATRPNDLSGLQSLLMSVHFMGATILHTPELMLTEDESKQFATALQNVAKHHPMVMSPEKLAYTNLAMCLAGIYGTRALAIRNRIKRDATKTLPASNLRQMPSPQVQQQQMAQQVVQQAAPAQVVNGVQLAPNQLDSTPPID